MDFAIFILLCAVFIVLIITLIFSIKSSKNGLSGQFFEENRQTRKEITDSVRDNIKTMSDMLNESQRNFASAQQISQQSLQASIEKRLSNFEVQNEQKLENIRTTMQRNITSMQEDNNKKLEQMRQTVDEKLQKTLDEKLTQSFATVSERLEQVYKGLGEMQNIATGVGDLKKVLSNVKTRGTLGEIQLGAILEQILAPDQYEENIATVKGSSERVEFAVKLPADDGKTIYLPIDSKFPADVYSKLTDAYDTGDVAIVEAAAKELITRIKGCAKDIHNKYVSPPETTDFAIMFLPFEGLYAEVVRRGLIEILQRDYKICIAGPTTMSALLNSLQMGFKTLAIQKRSGEVWDILSAVKTEFDNFGNVLTATQQRINQANDELDKLVGVRTRQIQRKLKSVSSMPEAQSNKILGDADIDED